MTRGNEGSIFYNSKKKNFVTCPAFASNISDKVGRRCNVVCFLYFFTNFKIQRFLFFWFLAAANSLTDFGNDRTTKLINLQKIIQHLTNKIEEKNFNFRKFKFCLSFNGKFYFKKRKFKILSTYRKKKLTNIYPLLTIKNFKKIKQFKIDLLKDTKPLLKIFKNFKPDYIIDFASICMVNESWSKPDLYFKTNVLSKAKILNYLTKAKFLKNIFIFLPQKFLALLKNI